ncbi:hypothetical protein GobsT_53920 [Gemmata obscuriglobus]|nr:hypothetical protein GobsT_53920 [Gemmata obscuriglobus]VTS09911.1 hypothetical protein : : Secretin [Gemmata obscuriglobus UQM 2246]
MALVAVGLGAVAANNGPPVAAPTPPVAPVKELAKEPVDKPTANADEVTGLDWAKDEELAKRAVEALKRDPKAVPSVVIQSVCVHVPDGFCKRAGMTPTTPPVAGAIIDQWQLSQRETRMLKGLLGAEQSRSIVHRRQLVVTDRAIGAAETLQNLNVVTDVESTTEEGAQIYTARTVSANVGLKFKFAPQIMFTGDVHLDIKLTCYSIDIPTVVGGKRVAVFNEAGLNVTSPIPDGGTLVVKAVHRGIPWQSPISIGGASLTEVRSDNTPYEMLQFFTVYATAPSKKLP